MEDQDDGQWLYFNALEEAYLEQKQEELSVKELQNEHIQEI